MSLAEAASLLALEREEIAAFIRRDPENSGRYALSFGQDILCLVEDRGALQWTTDWLPRSSGGSFDLLEAH